MNLIGYFLTYANLNVDQEDMRDLDVRARVCSRTDQEKDDLYDSRSN